MSIRCTKCGTFLTESDRFCPACGENAPQQVITPQPEQNNTYNQPEQNNYSYGQPSPPPYAPTNAPQYNPYAGEEEEMTVGKWFLTVFVTSLGLIGLIFLFIWGFGSGPKSRQNFCKAMLIFRAISFALTFILVFIYIGAFGAIIAGVADGMSDYDYSSMYAIAKSMLTIFGN